LRSQSFFYSWSNVAGDRVASVNTLNSGPVGGLRHISGPVNRSSPCPTTVASPPALAAIDVPLRKTLRTAQVGVFRSGNNLPAGSLWSQSPQLSSTGYLLAAAANLSLHD
jgi:hypothetical protein